MTRQSARPPAQSSWPFGVAPTTYASLQALFERTPGLECVWVYGSRARGDHRAQSDIDLVADMPVDRSHFVGLLGDIEELTPIYRVDMVCWQETLADDFRARIQQDRQLFWAPRKATAAVEAVGGTQLKKFQGEVLEALGRYLDELKRCEANSRKVAETLGVMEGMEDVVREAADFPEKTWAALQRAGHLPAAFASQPHSSRFDGAGRPIPNICLKVPTGGGKTLLAAASVARVMGSYLNRHAGLVLWVVPNEAIYHQTLKSLSDRDHPYRQMLNVAGAGRVKILEKQTPLSRLDVESHLCVMVLMLQSAARQSKETLRFFRDRGNVLGFLPREDDIEAHWSLLQEVPNLDVYTAWGGSTAEARAQKGSIVKSSLGNVMRLLRPMVVIDEGHHAYSENALNTIDGFNPSLLLELSATPRLASKKGGGSNILVDIRGKDLDEAEMIKLPIHVDVKHWNDWQSCLAASVARLDELQREADAMQAETARYIRPILLVQVERTGADLRDAGYIHAEDAKAYLLQMGLSERQIAIKTSEKNDLKQPENIDLMSPNCEVRAIITKQALQEGWDCPFAYVLCALAAGRNPAAMTQLVGRILRLPHVAKTGRPALDACYVLCHDAKTGDVVGAVKKSLEEEGMGDLAIAVSGGSDASSEKTQIALKRRPQFARLRLFVPKVTWVAPGQARRELCYESDILAHLPWQAFDVSRLALDWAPDSKTAADEHLIIDLSVLTDTHERYTQAKGFEDSVLDRARLVRALLDLAPNAWIVWGWIEEVLARLFALGFTESALAASSGSLIERLRVDIEAERDRQGQVVFNQFVKDGRIEFSLRADAADYELPAEATLQLTGKPRPLLRPDARPVERSLLEPALQTPDMNDFEAQFAGYLDGKTALEWWHRNVARTQYGLQGWRRHKVYPDFVFGLLKQSGDARVVLMETKGMHLDGSDTRYKQALLERLSQAFKDERHVRAGELLLTGSGKQEVVCDLIFDQAWQGLLEKRYFA